jgi:transcriptional regulator with XRE-family HTH domain
MSATVHRVTGHVKYGNLSAHELARLARFREMAERQLLHLGAAIADARKAKNWSRSALGKKIPVEEKTVERWEKGQTGGAMESLEVIAAALETTSDDLLAAAAAKGAPTRKPESNDLLGALNGAGRESALEEAVSELTKKVVALETALTGELAKVQKALEAQQKQLERVGRSPAAKKK